jgi:hypothetical protein
VVVLNKITAKATREQLLRMKELLVDLCDYLHDENIPLPIVVEIDQVGVEELGQTG